MCCTARAEWLSGEQGASRLSLYHHREGDHCPPQIKTRLYVSSWPVGRPTGRGRSPNLLLREIAGLRDGSNGGSLCNHKYSAGSAERGVTQTVKFRGSSSRKYPRDLRIAEWTFYGDRINRDRFILRDSCV